MISHPRTEPIEKKTRNLAVGTFIGTNTLEPPPEPIELKLSEEVTLGSSFCCNQELLESTEIMKTPVLGDFDPPPQQEPQESHNLLLWSQ